MSEREALKGLLAACRVGRLACAASDGYVQSLIEAGEAALARSGQAASGSSQGARSDDQSGAGQPEAPTAAALVRDAARYRFLRDNDKRHFWPPVHGSMWVVAYHQPPGVHAMPETRGAGYGADLDVAIDAAIAAARSGAGSEES